MRVAIAGVIQHSMFSSGLANSSLAIAELFRALGHDVDLVQVADASRDWWDDCEELKGRGGIRVVPLATATSEAAAPYDLLIEIGSILMGATERAKLAHTAGWVIRSPFLLREMEAGLFPVEVTPRRDLTGVKEIWAFDTAVEEPGAAGLIETLFRVPVRRVPFVWTPSVAAAYKKEGEIADWHLREEPC